MFDDKKLDFTYFGAACNVKTHIYKSNEEDNIEGTKLGKLSEII